jgi:hypothetical protein
MVADLLRETASRWCWAALIWPQIFRCRDGEVDLEACRIKDLSGGDWVDVEVESVGGSREGCECGAIHFEAPFAGEKKV